MTEPKHTWVRIEDVGELGAGEYVIQERSQDQMIAFWDTMVDRWVTYRDDGCGGSELYHPNVAFVLNPRLGPIPECDE